MSGSHIALDTNEAIAVLNNAGDAGRWITALCIQHRVPLATSDEHFAHVTGLEIVTR